MADKSNIEWTDATWNPIVGCSIHSPGCANCYAMPMAKRIEAMFAGTTGAPQYRGLTKTVKGKAVFTGKVAQAPDHILTQPLCWKRGRRIFVNSMGDLFHESVPDEWIDKVFAVMALCPQHTFQVLTKRAGRMRAWFANPDCADNVGLAMLALVGSLPHGHRRVPWPLANVWLGVSAERQQEADERIPDLLETPAAVRFVSVEPLLGPIDLHPQADGTYQRLSEWYGPNGFDPTGSQPRRERVTGLFLAIDWLIVGGESGPNARPMHPDWARSLRDQCAAAGVPFFFKQWGEYRPPTENDLAWRKLGKKSSGRLLDGKEHNEFPVTNAETQAA